MADTLLGAVSQRLGTGRRTVKPGAETARVRPCLFPGVDGHEKCCVFSQGTFVGIFFRNKSKALDKG